MQPAALDAQQFGKFGREFGGFERRLSSGGDGGGRSAVPR
jgi:hypothetical protein